jgi:hypothetical protein
VLAIALVVPSWSGHPQGFGLLRPLGERLSARASGPAPTPGPAGAEPALSADATTSPAAGRPNALDPGAPAPPTDSKDADTSPSASPAATNEPTRPGEEPRLAALQPPLRDVLRQMMARGGRAAGSGDDSEATPPTGAAASAAEPPADASAPAPRAGTQPADVRATRSEELFTGYEIPLRLRAYVRDYLLAIGGSR